MPRLTRIGKVPSPLYRSAPHNHSYWELCIYTAGEGVALIGDRRIPFKAGTIICYPPIIPHEEDSPGGCLEYWMATEGFTSSSPDVPVFADSEDGAFERITIQLYNEYHLKEPGWEQVVQHLFQILLTYIDRWRGADHHPLVSQLKLLIMGGIGNAEFDLVAAMESLPMSTDHLRRLFGRVTGSTPSAYLASLRIEEAKRLLRVLRLGVKETSWQVGFRNPAYFSRVFRKQTGQWPSEFLKSGE